MIYRLPRWRKDFDALNDAQIFDSCEHAHDLEVNVDGSTSLYGVCYHAVFFLLFLLSKVSLLHGMVHGWEAQ